MALITLREEVLKNSGILTEEILEEGFFKKALAIATVIAALGGAAFIGPKVTKEVKQYKNVKDVPVATRYEKADIETNKNIKNKEYENTFKSSWINKVFEKMKYVKSIKSEYNDRNNQAVLNIYIDFSFEGGDLIEAQDRLKEEITSAFNEYTTYLNNQYSKIEDKIGKTEFNRTPLKVVYNISVSDYIRSYMKKVNVLRTDELRRIAKQYTGTDSVEFAF